MRPAPAPAGPSPCLHVLQRSPGRVKARRLDQRSVGRVAHGRLRVLQRTHQRCHPAVLDDVTRPQLLGHHQPEASPQLGVPFFLCLCFCGCVCAAGRQGGCAIPAVRSARHSATHLSAAAARSRTMESGSCKGRRGEGGAGGVRVEVGGGGDGVWGPGAGQPQHCRHLLSLAGPQHSAHCSSVI